MANITVSTKVITARTDSGRFANKLDRAANRVIDRTVDEGVKLSKGFAPVRSGKLRRSIKGEKMGHRGSWYATSPHAPYIEFGTSAHLIVGYLSFYWKGGHFVWNDPRFGPVGSGKGYENWDEGGAWVRHPGNKAQPFLAPSLAIMKGRMMQIVREEYH